MGIPDLNEIGELPEGEHEATLGEIRKVFGTSNECRKYLLKGLASALLNLEKAGVRRVFIDGSFVTSKDEPNDIDGCWEYNENVIVDELDPVFLNSSRKPMNQKYGVEFFISQFTETSSGLPFPSFFQVNRDGNPKGILVIKLGDRE